LSTQKAMGESEAQPRTRIRKGKELRGEKKAKRKKRSDNAEAIGTRVFSKAVKQIMGKPPEERSAEKQSGSKRQPTSVT